MGTRSDSRWGLVTCCEFPGRHADCGRWMPGVRGAEAGSPSTAAPPHPTSTLVVGETSSSSHQLHTRPNSSFHTRTTHFHARCIIQWWPKNLTCCAVAQPSAGFNSVTSRWEQSDLDKKAEHQTLENQGLHQMRVFAQQSSMGNRVIVFKSGFTSSSCLFVFFFLPAKQPDQLCSSWTDNRVRLT